jgi:chromate reductase
MFKVGVIVGSLSSRSINKKLAKALMKLGEGKFAFTVLRIDDLPLYNYDLDANLPEAAKRLKSEIEASDALLFVTPEYLRTIPAALKNAIEWGSRPWGKNSFAEKPAAVCGTSGGGIATAAAQQHLRNILAHDGLHVLGQPEVFVQMREGLIADDGTIADASTQKFLAGFLDKFEAWIGRFVTKHG